MPTSTASLRRSSAWPRGRRRSSISWPAEAFVWQRSPHAFLPVPHVNRQPLGLLKGIERASGQLLDNTRRFAQGLPANNALLWGARGMGKSSLVKAAHADVRSELGPARRQARSQAGRDPSRGHRHPARLPCAPARMPRTASSCSATTFPSTRTTPPTSRSRRCWRAASRAGRRTCCSTPPPTAAT